MISALNNLTIPQSINNYTQQNLKPETTYTDKPENSSNNSFLGNASIGNISLSAEYSSNSSYDNPIVSVTIKSDNVIEKIDININSVNPQNATTLEMFAFCKYTEAKLPDSPMFFAAWEKLTQFQEIAEKNTVFHKADFLIDKQILKKAAESTSLDDKNYIWISRKGGTHCFNEKNSFIADTPEYNKFMFYKNHTDVFAFSVDIKEMQENVIKGNIYVMK